MLEAISPNGILGNSLFHDAQHPNLRAYAAIASAVLGELGGRRAFGLRPSAARVADPGECAKGPA